MCTLTSEINVPITQLFSMTMDNEINKLSVFYFYEGEDK